MTFSCKNFDFNTEDCLKLNSECIPGRPGCVLIGKVKFSEDIEKRLKDLETETSKKKKRHR
jgi:hypothetical protein